MEAGRAPHQFGTPIKCPTMTLATPFPCQLTAAAMLFHCGRPRSTGCSGRGDAAAARRGTEAGGAP
jgi:hypothetical protein